MNIQLLTPKFNHSNQKFSNNTGVLYSKLSALNKDIVCFTGVQNKAAKSTTTHLKDILCYSYEKLKPEYQIYANRLMAALSSIATKFKDKGVKFDEDYCRHAAVKSTESFISKFLRSGEKPLDRIRSTLYVENPHDFNLINEILNELRLCGYEVAKKAGTKRPDFDIRLADVTPKELQALRTDLQQCLGKPQGNGYEDIQIRLTDITNKKAPAMELIILFGKATANAKIDESKYSYNIRRALQKLLHVNKVENPQIDTPAYKIKNKIKIICDMLSSAISKPLFINAKNEDYLHDNFRLAVELGEKTCTSLIGMAEDIRYNIPKHYRTEAQKIKSDEYEKEIIKQIKASPFYKEREDKTIYAADIIEKRNNLLAELKQHKTDDLELIHKVQNALDKTVAKYGSKPAVSAKKSKS